MSSKLAVVRKQEPVREPAEVAWMRFGVAPENQVQPADRVRNLTKGLTSAWTEDLAQAERYQVALVPLPGVMERVDKDAPVFTDLQSVLVLPLTWKDVVTRLHSRNPLLKSCQNGEVITFGLNSVKLSSMEVRRSGKTLLMTALEFKMLRYFLFNPGRVISRDELLNEVWGFDNYPCTRTVDTHMWRLRQKLESDPANPTHFHTVHAMGYKFLP
jgi:two-component system alkaline phosphatase synthesis response regulator PhoP